VMSARAREARGQGTATAQVEMFLSGDNGATHGRIATEVALSGRAAAMGQGVIQDVSARIVDQFAENLAAMLGGATPAGAGAEAPATAAAPASAEAPAAPHPPAAAAPTRDEGLDILPIVSGVARERLRDPRVIGVLALVLVLLLRRRR
jgi:hypothetical protein